MTNPPLIDNSIKRLIQDKNEAYKRFKRSNSNSQQFENFQSLQKRRSRDYSRLSKKKNGFIHKSQKICQFYCNNKIPCIPLIFHDNRFVTNSKENAELFHSFFARQCSITDNGSEILSFIDTKTHKSLSDITFTEKDMEKILQNLDSNKDGHDMISMHMLIICGKSIIKPLLIIYNKWLEKGCFPN